MLFENVTKEFEGGVFAVKDLTLEVKDKEFVVLLGPSGCGKTTTLRLLAGLETPTAGNVYIDGKLVNSVEPWARDVAMVFQSYALYPHMSVFDNIAFPLKMHKVPKAEIKDRVEKTAEFLEIKQLLQRRPRQLSGGQRQRVALARAVVRNPKVFLMDEPLSNLDAKLRVLMRIELKKLQRRLGVTTIYVTHDQTEAMTLADRVAIQYEGVLQQYAPPTEIFAHPANRFVAGFVGTPPMNFIAGKLSAKGKLIVLEAGEFNVEINPNLAARLLEAVKPLPSDVTYGIRPEDIEIAKEGEPPQWIEGEVYGVELLGSQNIVHAQIDQTRIVTAAPATELYQMGEKVWLRLTSNRAHFFDINTERNLLPSA